MASSGRQAIGSVILLLAASVWFHAQTIPQKIASASISGKITIKGKPAVGVPVVAGDPNSSTSSLPRYRARTDQTGTYRITNLPAGTYKISPITPALVPVNESEPIIVSEGEQVKDINVSLVPGGVITGKITDSGGEPLIGQFVMITPVYEQRPGVAQAGFSTAPMRGPSRDNNTDDRGVYRAFGLPPGKYKVSVDTSHAPQSSREYYEETFYPSVTDAAKATIIEVTEGSETKDVDIALGRPIRKFSIAGRVVDGESGSPIPNLNYDVTYRTDDGRGSGSSSTWTGGITNANGEFRVEIKTPGTYTISTTPPDGSDLVDASITVEVVDRDRTDLLIKTTKGGSLSGVVALDGNESALTTLSGLRVYAAVTSPHSDSGSTAGSVVAPDGTFRINGVGSGSASLAVSYFGDRRMKFEIVRAERNGIPFETTNIKEREHVAGIRVVVKSVKLTGAIRGQVKLENGELPPISRLYVSLWPLDENLQPKRSPIFLITTSGHHWMTRTSQDLNARGFMFNGVDDGDYSITALSQRPDGEFMSSAAKHIKVRGADVNGVELVVQPLSSVAGRVVLEETKTTECSDKQRLVFPETLILAQSNVFGSPPSWFPGSIANPDERGNISLKNLTPGRYYFNTQYLAKEWYLKSVSLLSPETATIKDAKPLDAARSWTMLKPGERLNGLTLTVAQGAASLRGRIALSEGEALGEKLHVFLVPAEKETADNPLRFYGAPVTAEGKVALNNLAPGRYLVLAQGAVEEFASTLTRLRSPDETAYRMKLRREAETLKAEIELKPCQRAADLKVRMKTNSLN